MTGISDGNGAAGDGNGRAGDSGAGETSASPSLLQFPTAFPIKIMGRSVDGFAPTIADLVRSTHRTSTRRRSNCARRPWATTCR